jgi:KUP system potassium uptake protein
MRAEGRIPRVPGTAVFLTRTLRDAPPVMVWHLTHNRALHEYLFVPTVNTEPTPWVTPSERLSFEEIAPHLWRASTLAITACTTRRPTPSCAATLDGNSTV